MNSLKALFLIFCMFTVCVYADDTIKIDRNSRHVIVVGEKANRVTLFAAQQLKVYLKKITGADIPISKDSKIQSMPLNAFFIGESKFTKELGVELEDPNPEAFIIKNIGGRIVMIGDDVPKEKGDEFIPFSYFYSRKGSVFAVYEFLERFGGVRWIFPGEVGEVIPALESITLSGIDIQSHPQVKSRQFWGYGYGIKEPSPFTLSPKNTAEFSLWLMRLRHGVPLELGFRAGFAHSWGDYMEGNKYFASHPEYYALVDGERRGAIANLKGEPAWLDKGWQVCTSNPDVIDIFAKRICSMYKPEDDCIVSLFPNDGGGFCQCDSCKALDHPELYGPTEGYRGVVFSDRIYTFVNAVAKKVRQTHPRLRIGFCAYTFYTPPPKTISQFEPNIIIKVTEQPESFYFNQEYCSRIRRYIDEWSVRVPGIFIGEHYDEPDVRVPVSYYLPLVSENTRRLTSRGIQGISMQIYPFVASQHFDYYLISRLLWDGRQDVEKLLRDYLEKGYGSAAPAMRRYFDFMSETFKKRQAAADTSVTMGAITMLWLPEDIQKASALLDEAAGAADSDAVKKRIEFVRKGCRHIELLRAIVEKGEKMAEAGYPIPLLKNQTFYADSEVLRSISDEDAAEMILQIRKSYRELLAFFKENCNTPGLDPRGIWAYALQWGYPQTIEAYGAFVDGKGKAIIMEDAENGRLRGWTKINKNASISEAFARSGKKSIALNVEGPGSQLLASRSISVEEGKSYIVSLYYRPVEMSDLKGDEKTGLIQGPELSIRFLGPDGVLSARSGHGCRPVFITNSFKPGFSEWIRLSRVFQVPVNVGANKINLGINVPPGKWLIDDITLTEAGTFDARTGVIH